MNQPETRIIVSKRLHNAWLTAALCSWKNIEGWNEPAAESHLTSIINADEVWTGCGSGLLAGQCSRRLSGRISVSCPDLNLTAKTELEGFKLAVTVSLGVCAACVLCVCVCVPLYSWQKCRLTSTACSSQSDSRCDLFFHSTLQSKEKWHFQLGSDWLLP